MSNGMQVPRSQSCLGKEEEGGPSEHQLGTQFPEFPEGGWEGWATAIGAFLVQFSTFGYSLSFGVYQDFYTRTYISNETPSTIAWIGSTNTFLFEICGLVAGRLYDRGYFYHLLYGASLLQAFSLFMLSLARQGSYYQVFLAQGIGSGCAAGLLYVPSMAVVSHHFDKRRDRVMTFASSGAFLGAAVHPIMLNNTINGLLGFANGVRASAGLVSGLLLIACLLMRTRLPPSESHTDFVGAVKKCRRDSAFIFGSLGLCIFSVAFYYPIFYLQLDAVRHNLGNAISFYSLVIVNMSSFAGPLCLTALVGYLRVDTLMIICTFCASVILFGMAGVRTVGGVVTFGVSYGFFAGIFSALWTPVLVLLTPDLSELGVRMGIGCVGMAFCSLVGPPILGAILTPAYIWWRGAVFSGVAGALGCTMFVAMRHVLARRPSKFMDASVFKSASSTSTDVSESLEGGTLSDSSSLDTTQPRVSIRVELDIQNCYTSEIATYKE